MVNSTMDIRKKIYKTTLATIIGAGVLGLGATYGFTWWQEALSPKAMDAPMMSPAERTVANAIDEVPEPQVVSSEKKTFSMPILEDPREQQRIRKQNLLVAFSKTQTKESRDEIRSKLIQLVEEEFSTQIDASKQRLDANEEQLRLAREQLAQRETQIKEHALKVTSELLRSMEEVSGFRVSDTTSVSIAAPVAPSFAIEPDASEAVLSPTHQRKAIAAVDLN
jgi:hypothetical protein